MIVMIVKFHLLYSCKNLSYTWHVTVQYNTWLCSNQWDVICTNLISYIAVAAFLCSKRISISILFAANDWK